MWPLKTGPSWGKDTNDTCTSNLSYPMHALNSSIIYTCKHEGSRKVYEGSGKFHDGLRITVVSQAFTDRPMVIMNWLHGRDPDVRVLLAATPINLSEVVQKQSVNTYFISTLCHWLLVEVPGRTTLLPSRETCVSTRRTIENTTLSDESRPCSV